jgi:hypothetical protein
LLLTAVLIPKSNGDDPMVPVLGGCYAGETMNQKPKKIRFMKDLAPDQQRWLALAVVNILMSDQLLDEKEAVFLRKLAKVFDNEESRDVLREIARLVKSKASYELDRIKVDDPERLIFMLNTMCSAIFANEKKQVDEVKSYFQAGLRLGVTYEILMLKLAYQKERFRLKQAQKQVDQNIRELVAIWKAKER